MPDPVPPLPPEQRRVCYFAHYDPDDVVGEHVLHYLRALRAAGFALIVGTPCPLPPAELAKLEALAEQVLVRDNVGMDFGTWIDLLDHFPPGETDLVLMANDSVYAPIGDLPRFFERLLATPADFYGAVASGEIVPHLQSWLVLLRPAAHQSAAFRTLMARGAIAADTSKTEIVDRFELGMTQRLFAAGLRFHAAYDWRRDSRIAARLPFNPMHLLWDELIAADLVPFLKVELLRFNPANVAGVESWRGVVGACNPALVPMIEADLARRATGGSATPIVRPLSRTRLKGAPDPIYRRQLRPGVVRDFRSARAGRNYAAAWNGAALTAAWQYSRIGRVVKWWVLDGVAVLGRRLRHATDRGTA